MRSPATATAFARGTRGWKVNISPFAKIQSATFRAMVVVGKSSAPDAHFLPQRITRVARKQKTTLPSGKVRSFHPTRQLFNFAGYGRVARADFF
jgi:hypothetical protein